ncbi:cytochrome b [Sedimenticola selenatireducens]|uniref:Cytochrome b n=1 Tax=Sedimenticola selenatireducens TaxID=191960 RepID=A0A2N6CSB8_9GAMM|nr:cytochrome b [Sedimenticola selenatireducens]PLX59979.1 MAG: cytochrome b [Sedimenticola selenatireducens]
MRFANTRQAYGVISIGLHWLIALLVIGLFLLGLYMTSLDYYDTWYQAAPDMHRSLGIVMVVLLLFRLLWRLISPLPEPVGNDPRILRRAAELVHWGLYLLLFAIAISGYLISTADGRGIEVFGWFTLPALLPAIDNMEDVAGEIHWVLAVVMMTLVGVHSLAALKHHFIDRDATLMRMLGRPRRS